MEGFDHHGGVGRVGSAFAAVASAAVPGVADIDFSFAFGAALDLVGPLQRLQIGDGFVDAGFVGGFVGGREGGDGDCGVIVGEQVFVDAAIFHLEGEEFVVPFFDEVGVGGVFGVLDDCPQDDGGDGGGLVGGAPGAVGLLLGFEEVDGFVDGGLGFFGGGVGGGGGVFGKEHSS